MINSFKLVTTVRSEYNGFESFKGKIVDMIDENRQVGKINLLVSIPLRTKALSVYDMFNTRANLSVFLPFIDEEEGISSKALESLYSYFGNPFLLRKNNFEKIAVLDHIHLDEDYRGDNIMVLRFLDLLITLNLHKLNIPILVNCVPTQYSLENCNADENPDFNNAREKLKVYYEKLGFVEFNRDKSSLLMLSTTEIVSNILIDRREDIIDAAM